MFHIFTSFYKTKKALEFYLSLNPSYSIFLSSFPFVNSISRFFRKTVSSHIKSHFFILSSISSIRCSNIFIALSLSVLIFTSSGFPGIAASG